MISIIIPCYNQGAYLQDAIDSVKAQTYTDWEIIIVDDGSNDEETISIIKSINEEKVAIYFQQNLGVSVARNIGAQYSKGDYLLFLDADDKIVNNYLKTAINAFNLNDNLSYVYCDIQEFGDTNKYRNLEQLDIRKTLIHNQTHVSGIMKKSLWIQSKGFDPLFRKGWEDWDFMIRILILDFEYLKISEAMLFYRIRNQSRDKTAIELHKNFLLNQIFLKHINSYLKYFETPISLLRNDISQKREIEQLYQKVFDVYKTYSYKIGSFLLTPIKILKSNFFTSK